MHRNGLEQPYRDVRQGLALLTGGLLWPAHLPRRRGASGAVASPVAHGTGRRRGRGVPAGHPRQGRARDRRADVARRAARPQRPAHLARRRAAHGPTRPAPPRSPAPSPSTPTTRKVSRASASTRTSQQPGDLPLLRAPARHPRRRRPRDRHRRGLRQVRRRQPALPLRPQGGRDPRPGQREEGPRRRDHPRHLLPRRRRHRLRRRRATSTCRPATTPTRSPPTATRRSTNAPGRNPAFDARRTSGNTNDLRGKILRIKVADDGVVHRSPTGNLFAPGTDRTRPEIYAMGFRNPFRFSVDKTTGIVYVGDYGPDAGAADPDRGPGGQVEFAGSRSRQLRLAVLHRRQRRLHRLRLRHRHVRADVRLRRAEEHLAAQHRPDRPAAGPGAPGSPTTAAPCPSSAAARESPMGGPVYHYDAGSTPR